MNNSFRLAKAFLRHLLPAVVPMLAGACTTQLEPDAATDRGPDGTLADTGSYVEPTDSAHDARSETATDARVDAATAPGACGVRCFDHESPGDFILRGGPTCACGACPACLGGAICNGSADLTDDCVRCYARLFEPGHGCGSSSSNFATSCAPDATCKTTSDCLRTCDDGSPIADAGGH